MDKESNFCTESRPVRLGDFLYIFSDGYGNVNYIALTGKVRKKYPLTNLRII